MVQTFPDSKSVIPLVDACLVQHNHDSSPPHTATWPEPPSPIHRTISSTVHLHSRPLAAPTIEITATPLGGTSTPQSNRFKAKPVEHHGAWRTARGGDLVAGGLGLTVESVLVE